jgi:hypothetical protein
VKTFVAVKDKFVQEAEIACQLAPHPNVITIGYCLSPTLLCVGMIICKLLAIAQDYHFLRFSRDGQNVLEGTLYKNEYPQSRPSLLCSLFIQKVSLTGPKLQWIVLFRKSVVFLFIEKQPCGALFMFIFMTWSLRARLPGL